MHLACVDNLAEDNNGENYLLGCHSLVDRTVDAKGRKTKDCKETVRAFLTMITKIWVVKGTKFPGRFKKLCKAEGKQFYSTMSETKAAATERTIRSLKKFLDRYMEDCGYNYVYKLTHVITTFRFWRICSIVLKSKIVKRSDFPTFHTFWTGNLYENLVNQF